jgi:hypothetical protein
MPRLIGKRKAPTFSNGAGVFTLREQAQFARDALWPKLDRYYDYVSLLLPFNGANESTTFTDVSKNAFTITPSGGAKISTTQSQFGGASGYFDGVDDYLSIPNNAAFDIGISAEPFTIECWVYPLVNSSGIIFNRCGDFSEPYWTSTSGHYYLLNLSTANGCSFSWYDGVDGTPKRVRYTDNLTLNAWSHVTVCLSGGVVSLYVNGDKKEESASTALVKPTQANLTFVGDTHSFLSAPFNGYIDDLRVTKGIARYTANFTPPDALLY